MSGFWGGGKQEQFTRRKMQRQIKDHHCLYGSTSRQIRSMEQEIQQGRSQTVRQPKLNNDYNGCNDVTMAYLIIYIFYISIAYYSA
jgi:hypothetical protein